MSTKQLLTRPNSTYPHSIEVYYEGGGEVPDTLKGLYTHKSVADVAIKQYLESKGGSRGKRNS